MDRYWLDDAPPDTKGTPIEGWYGVVDEERGGIIAYFGKEEDALDYIEWLQDPIKKED